MIITCNNCYKKFDIEINLIPEKGRLLQCSSCNQKWFFKKKIVDSQIKSIKINKPLEEPKIFNEELNPEKIEISESMDLLEESTKDNFVNEKIPFNNEKDKNNKDSDLEINISKNKKNYNILNLTIVFLISFVALIIVLDTFKAPIGKIVPNMEFLLYNLYETINDIELFFRDLI